MSQGHCQAGFDAGLDHRKVQRLGDVVVGAQAQRLHGGFPIVLGGHDEDGQIGGAVTLAQPFQHGQTADVRYAGVEQDGVERLRGG